MTTRRPVSIIYNEWQDAQRVDQPDMVTEQSRNVGTDAATIQNHFGSGVIPEFPIQPILFDSNSLDAAAAALLAAGDFDGTGISPTTQPSDSVLGNQLQVELTNSSGVFGRISTKVLVIGLDFQGNIQYDRFTFYKNEKQVTEKHYTRILSLFFNDFLGNTACSRNLGGRVTVKQANSFQLSRDPIMVAQDVEPNLFFRDFKPSNFAIGPNPTITLYQTIQAGIGPEYSVDSLDINTTVKRNVFINANDTATQLGQKFQAVTNNIQKVTLLLGAGRDDSVPVQNRYDWTGDILISIHELQTTVNCVTDIVPGLQIEFDPKPNPIAQISYSQVELADVGYVLTDVLQPVDFFFGDTSLGSTTGSVIVPDRYYIITIKRSGSANNGSIFTGVGNNKIEDSRYTTFNGAWVDVVEEDMWFQIYTDAAKVSDGSGYDFGIGIQIPKTEVNEFGATIDYALDDQTFTDSGQNILNTGIIQAVDTLSQEEQDERTGNPVFSRQMASPQFSFVTNATLAQLEETAEPLIIGCAQDTNPKSNSLLEKIQDLPGLVKGDIFTIVQPDADLLSLNLLGSKLVPNDDCAAKNYRIFRSTLCVDGYGDVNGDGYIDGLDVARATELLGESLASNSTQQKIVDGYISTLEMLRADVDGDGYITSVDIGLLNQFIRREINSFPVGVSFNHLELQVQQSIGRYDGYFDCDGYVRLDGYTGLNIVSPEDLDPYELIYDGYLLTPDMNGSDPVFDDVPYIPIPYAIIPQPFWQSYLLAFSSESRLVPTTFTYSQATSAPNCQSGLQFNCSDRSLVEQDCNPGRNDIMFPDNLIMRRGQILNPDGSHYAVDLEVVPIVIELPAVPLEESIINVFDKLVADFGSELTAAGFPAMRFSDCTTVKPEALLLQQVRFGVSIQSFYPNLDGYTELDGYGVIVDDIIGVYMNPATGIMTLTIKDLALDPVYLTLVTKIQVMVYLKKAGWKNAPRVVQSTELQGLLS